MSIAWQLMALLAWGAPEPVAQPVFLKRLEVRVEKEVEKLPESAQTVLVLVHNDLKGINQLDDGGRPAAFAKLLKKWVDETGREGVISDKATTVLKAAAQAGKISSDSLPAAQALEPCDAVLSVLVGDTADNKSTVKVTLVTADQQIAKFQQISPASQASVTAMANQMDGGQQGVKTTQGSKVFASNTSITANGSSSGTAGGKAGGAGGGQAGGKAGNSPGSGPAKADNGQTGQSGKDKDCPKDEGKPGSTGPSNQGAGSTTPDNSKPTTVASAISAANQQTVPDLNQKVLKFAVEHIGDQVGNGECWTLAAEALIAAGAEPAHLYVFGKPLSDGQAPLPGDIIQFNSATFQSSQGTYQLGIPNHTAVVYRAQGNLITMLHQNVNGQRFVQTLALDFSTLTSGNYIIYRPVPRGSL